MCWQMFMDLFLKVVFLDTPGVVSLEEMKRYKLEHSLFEVRTKWTLYLKKGEKNSTEEPNFARSPEKPDAASDA